jgi:hypothetical protein
METLTTEYQVQWVLAMDARSVYEIGRRQGCGFLIHPFKGTIQEPKAGVGWVYVPYGSDGTVIPEEGIRRLRFLRDEGVRASQVIIGHEIETAPAEQRGDNRTRAIVVAGAIAALAIGAVAVAAAIAPVTVPAAVVAPVAAPSLSAVGAVGLLAGAVLVDPSLVIVLEGSGEWVQVYSWVDG